MSDPLPELRPGKWDAFRAFQQEGVAFSVSHGDAGLFWDCGSGKTPAAFAWACAESGPVIFITQPFARRQQAESLREWTHVEPFVVKPASDRRASDEAVESYLRRVPRPFLIVGWDSLRDPAIYGLLSSLRRPSIVYDESHEGKDRSRFKREEHALLEDAEAHVRAVNSALAPGLPTAFLKASVDPIVGPVYSVFIPEDSQASRAAALSKGASRRLVTTATPMPNGAIELWSQFRLLWPRFMDAHSFGVKFCAGARDGFGWRYEGLSNREELIALMGMAFHAVPSQVVKAELPPLHRIMHDVEPADLAASDQQDVAELRKAAAAANRFGGATRRRRGLMVEAAIAELAGRKWPYARDLTLDFLRKDRKVILFTVRRHHVDVLHRALHDVVPPGTRLWAADGSVSVDERDDIREAYMAAEGRAVLVATGDSFGESLNLHDTDDLICLDSPWTVRQLRQREGRVHRIGMRRDPTVHYLFAKGTRDNAVRTALVDKLVANDAILPDSQVAALRETLAGGTDDQLITAFLDSLGDLSESL